MTQSKLRIGHLNVRGLEQHIDGIKLVLNKNQYHLFAVTETKMKMSAPVGPVRIPAYNLIKHCLPCGRGRGTKTCGGVAIYLKKGIKAATILKSSFDVNTPLVCRVEYLAILAKINDLTVCVTVLYNPSGSNQLFSRSYEKLLLDLMEYSYDRLVILGDFNINVSAQQPSANLCALHQINSAFQLSVLPTEPTRFTDTSANTIDLMITNAPEHIIKSKTRMGSSISDHEIIYLIADVRVARPPPRVVKMRNYRNVDILQLQIDFQACDLQPFFNTADPNTKAQVLTSEMQRLLDLHAPERETTVRDQKTPWINASIKQSIETRNMAYSLYIRNPNRSRNDNQWKEYVRHRDRVKSLVFSAKKKYADKNFDHQLPAKTLWSNLRREGIHNNPKSNSSVDDCNLDELNAFFAEGHLQLLSPSNRYVTPPVSCRTNSPDPRPTLKFRHTHVNEISRKIYEIQSNAIGTDQIPISFLKLLCPYVLPILCNLFNAIIDSNTFPSIWKKALVTPIPKTSAPTDPKDYRPISVLPAISKIFEKVLLAQVTEHLENANPTLLAKHQSGYRRNFSTTTALAKVTHDIYSSFDKGHCTVMVLVDFSLAFNCVRHHLLEKKLRNEFLFSREACNMISSFLQNRSQLVKTGDSLSTEMLLSDGTPQGSCLSALLFSLYINSLPRHLKCEYHLYADDLQIYLSGPAELVDHIIAQVNLDLEAIVQWSDQNFLVPNPKKTQAIIFCRSGTITPNSAIKFRNEDIPLSSTVKNLGLMMDCNLNWTRHVNDVVSKVFGTLRTFRRFSSVLSQPTRLKLVQAVVVPILTYCDIVYYPGMSIGLRERIFRAFKSAIRFVFHLNRLETTLPVRKAILGHELGANYDLRIASFMRQAYHQALPEYIQQHLQRGRHERTRCFIVPQHATSGGKSLLVYGTSCWNRTPLDVKSKTSLASFKNAYKLTLE